MLQSHALHRAQELAWLTPALLRARGEGTHHWARSWPYTEHRSRWWSTPALLRARGKLSTTWQVLALHRAQELAWLTPALLRARGRRPPLGEVLALHRAQESWWSTLALLRAQGEGTHHWASPGLTQSTGACLAHPGLTQSTGEAGRFQAKQAKRERILHRYSRGTQADLQEGNSTDHGNYICPCKPLQA